MRQVPGTLRAERVPFATTRWSIIQACAETSETTQEDAQAAVAALCRDYWPPLYSFLRHRGYASPDAQDLTQGFFGYFLENRLYERADPAKGKFRSFILTLLKGYLRDAEKRETSQKRGGGQEFLLLEPDLRAAEAHCLYVLADYAALDEERFFERQWAEKLVSSALAALGEEYRSESKAELFESLKGFLIAGSDVPTQEELASRLHMPSATLRSHVTRLRARYRETLRAEVARTVSQEHDVAAELRYLCDVLMRG